MFTGSIQRYICYGLAVLSLTLFARIAFLKLELAESKYEIENLKTSNVIATINNDSLSSKLDEQNKSIEELNKSSEDRQKAVEAALSKFKERAYYAEREILKLKEAKGESCEDFENLFDSVYFK